MDKKKANEIEFDFELWSWHGIEDDIMTTWCKRFGEINVSVGLVNLREWLKRKPKFQETIDNGYKGNWVYFIWDCLERNEKRRLENENINSKKM